MTDYFKLNNLMALANREVNVTSDPLQRTRVARYWLGRLTEKFPELSFKLDTALAIYIDKEE